jgi:hypothetical protein
MWLSGSVGLGWSVILSFACVAFGVACGGEEGAPSQNPSPVTDESPTEAVTGSPGPAEAPAQEPPQEEETGPKPASVVSASPACAPVGSRVVLKLGMTFDHRSVDCYDVDRVQVVFAPEKHAKITVMGPMSDGFCAVDVEVPKGAETGPIRVDIGRDTFATEATFPVPCPVN